MLDNPISDVSDTAYWVAAFRGLEGERPDALFHDPLSAVLAGERGKAIARDMPYPKMIRWMMAVRTVAIDRLILEALAEGVDTVVNIGAGLDTRPYRLDLPKDLRWIEIDFPQTIAMKNEKLSGEHPRCQLSRMGIDVANRAEATRAYSEIGAQSKSVLVITEGVIHYLTNDQAGLLAEDLRKVPSFRYWIQDYLKASRAMPRPKSLRAKLKNAPLVFRHADPLGFFSGFGWEVRHNITALDEADRVGRPLPLPFPFNLVLRLVPKSRQTAGRQMLGFALLEASK